MLIEGPAPTARLHGASHSAGGTKSSPSGIEDGLMIEDYRGDGEEDNEEQIEFPVGCVAIDGHLRWACILCAVAGDARSRMEKHCHARSYCALTKRMFNKKQRAANE